MTEKLLTAAEVIGVLRLDRLDDPQSALAHLRRTRRLPAVAIGRPFLYRQSDVDRLIASSLQGARTESRLGRGKSSRRRERSQV